MGIVPRPLQQPHPPLYAPFSYSMETAKFWAREGGKMVSLVPKDKEDFLKLSFDLYLEEAHRVGRRATPADAIAIGGLLILGRTPAEAKDLYAGFEALFNYAYNAPPYHVPMGRLWKGSPQELLDHVSSLAERFGVNEFFLVHHVGYFTQNKSWRCSNCSRTA